jgi:S1-C subfamily serine protease
VRRRAPSRPRVALAVAAATLAATPLVAAGRDAPPPPLGIVTVEAGGGSRPEVATGFVSGGRIVTVAHVVAGAPGRRVRLTVRGAGGERVEASVTRLDQAGDLAYLTAAGLRATPAPPVAGIRVLVRRAGGTVALPARVRRRFTATVTDAATGESHARAALELEVAIEAGDSGAPVVAPGRLLGVVFARSATRAATAYAVALPPPSSAASR